MIRKFEGIGVVSNWLPCAASQVFAGPIKGVYAHGFYIQDLHDDEARLIYLCDDKEPYLSVNGFRMEGLDWEAFRKDLQVNQLVIFKENQLSVYTSQGLVRIFLGKVTIQAMQGPDHLSQENKQDLTVLLDQERLYANCGLDTKTINRLKTLSQSSSEQLENFLESLIGQGQGLTPAGDDVLFGYLALKSIDQGRVDSLKAISNKICHQSTPVSAEFFKALSQGFLSETIRCLITKEIKEVKKLIHYLYHYGHTSGYDILLGMSLYLHGGNK